MASFFAFNFFLLPPFYTLRIANALDWWVLVAFLITAMVAAELVHRQQLATVTAERRTAEVERLAALGAESLSVPRAEDALDAITLVISSELPVSHASVLRPAALAADPVPSAVAGSAYGETANPELVAFALEHARIVGVRLDGTSSVQPGHASLATALTTSAGLREIMVPLRVRDRTVGVLRLADPEGLRFRSAQAAFADALAYYAALALDRSALEAEAEHVAALREADRLKDALLASVSHDLRTPLTAIRAAASELRSAGEERGAVIEEESIRLNRLVSDLLDLSRARAGALPVQPEINAAEDLVGAALHQLAGVPGAAEMTIRPLSGDPLLLGRFDFVHALRALSNLLENALRHSPEPSSVELNVRREDEQLVFEVADRGPGIQPGEEARMFEPYFRSASAAGAQGTGLGLAIARHVAEAQGGTVVYRPRPGGGSIFELRLPAADFDVSISSRFGTPPGSRALFTSSLRHALRSLCGRNRIGVTVAHALLPTARTRRVEPGSRPLHHHDGGRRRHDRRGHLRPDRHRGRDRAGPALILSSPLNGVITFLTAMVYAELGSAIPEAGGGYLWVKEGLPGPTRSWPAG